MKFTRKQVMNMIKEEIAAVLGEEEGSLGSAIDYLEKFINVVESGDPLPDGRNDSYRGERTFDQFFEPYAMPDDIRSTLYRFLDRKIEQEPYRPNQKPFRRMSSLFVDGVDYNEEIDLVADDRMPVILKHAKALVNLLKGQ